eukprot:1156129-Pelagomonas_calceolata.AAC.8
MQTSKSKTPSQLTSYMLLRGTTGKDGAAFLMNLFTNGTTVNAQIGLLALTRSSRLERQSTSLQTHSVKKVRGRQGGCLRAHQPQQCLTESTSA